MLPAAQFRAGSTQQHACAWDEWLGDEPSAQETLRVIREGVRFDFVRTDDPCQEKRPQHARRFRQVHSMLVRVFGAARAEVMLTGDRPHAARFPNKSSVREHADFMRKEVANLVATGAWTTWQAAGIGS